MEEMHIEKLVTRELNFETVYNIPVRIVRLCTSSRTLYIINGNCKNLTLNIAETTILRVRVAESIYSTDVLDAFIEEFKLLYRISKLVQILE